jgi:hypothetical protein
MWMKIAHINYFGVALRDRDDNITFRILCSEVLADHVLRGTKRLLEDMNYDVLVRIGTAILNKFIGTTGGARNVGCSADGIVSMVAFSLYYFQFAKSADCIEAFLRVPSSKFRSGSWQACDYSSN